jgi:hypothetical protein
MLLFAAGLVLGGSPESEMLKGCGRSPEPLTTLAILGVENSLRLCYSETVRPAQMELG